MKNRWVAFQEEDFSGRGSDISRRSINSDRVKKALVYVEKGMTVLDLGCNDGAITKRMEEIGAHVVGADLPRVAEIARKSFPGLTLVSCDLSSPLPIRAESCDLVLALELIEHILDAKALLLECHRVLKKRGRLVLSTPNVAFVRDRVWLLLGKYDDGDTHIHHFTFKSLEALVTTCGFSVLERKGYIYDQGSGNFFRDLWLHFRYHGWQNPLWFALERVLPRNFKAGIILVAQKI